MISSLRESGSIKQDSDIIIVLLRREYYDPYDKSDHAEIIVGNIEMTYRKEYTHFANFTPVKAEEDSAACSAFPPSR